MFFLSTILEWNKLDLNIRNSETLSVFLKKNLQFLRASPNTASRCCIAKRIKNRSHRKCAKHVAASTLYKNKLVIFNAVSFYVSMSPGLPQTFKHKLLSKVKVSGK